MTIVQPRVQFKVSFRIQDTFWIFSRVKHLCHLPLLLLLPDPSLPTGKRLWKARTWAWTTYLFHSMNFSDRKGSCWHRKMENLFLKNFCCLLSWTGCWSPLSFFLVLSQFEFQVLSEFMFWSFVTTGFCFSFVTIWVWVLS